MPITRSMSGATKKIQKVPQKDGFKPKWIPRTIEHDAFAIFMMKDYLKRYYETHPFPTTGTLSPEIASDGHSEWLNMSATDKDAWIEYTKKRMAEGTSLYHIRMECCVTYERH